jgi:hypothetical protein
MVRNPNIECVKAIQYSHVLYAELTQNGRTYPESYGEIFVMLTCEIYCRMPAVNVDIRANDYGEVTLDAEEGHI